MIKRILGAQKNQNMILTDLYNHTLQKSAYFYQFPFQFTNSHYLLIRNQQPDPLPLLLYHFQIKLKPR